MASPQATTTARAVFDDPSASPQDVLLAFAELRGDVVVRVPVPGRDVAASPDWSSAVLALYASAGIDPVAADVQLLEVQAAAMDDRLEQVLVPVVDAMAGATALSLKAVGREDALALRTSAAVLLLDAVDDARSRMQTTNSYPDCLAEPTPNSGLSIIDDCPSPTRPASPLPPEAWPAVVIADPLGLIEIGTIGNDVHATDRWLLIDPDGDDVWRNNAGGGEIIPLILPTIPPTIQPVVRPVGIAWDLDGADRYLASQRAHVQGAAESAVGVLLEDAGDDIFQSSSVSQGSAELDGVGILHDQGGDDILDGGFYSQGSAFNDAVGVYLDDLGNDDRDVASGQAESSQSDAYMRDGDGVDHYTSGGSGVLGRATNGRAFFREFGGDVDSYEHAGSNGGTWGYLFSNGPLPLTYAADGRDR